MIYVCFAIVVIILVFIFFMTYEGISKLGENQKKIYNKLKEIEKRKE